MEARDDVPSLSQHEQLIRLSCNTDLCIANKLRVRNRSARVLCDPDAHVQLISRV